MPPVQWQYSGGGWPRLELSLPAVWHLWGEVCVAVSGGLICEGKNMLVNGYRECEAQGKNRTGSQRAGGRQWEGHAAGGSQLVHRACKV